MRSSTIKLCRNPPEEGHVACFDEMGPLQTIMEGGQSMGKKAAKRPDRYKRNGTIAVVLCFFPYYWKSCWNGFSNKIGTGVSGFLGKSETPPTGVGGFCRYK